MNSPSSTLAIEGERAFSEVILRLSGNTFRGVFVVPRLRARGGKARGTVPHTAGRNYERETSSRGSAPGKRAIR
jgi:hypothetical protein